MERKRREMQGRIVPLRSAEAGDARVSGTPEERVALVAELTRRVCEVLSRRVDWHPAGMPAPLVVDLPELFNETLG